MIDTVFVPRGAEERAVRSALEGHKREIRVIATGIGPRAAGRAADEALASARFGTALVTGLCGALSPSLVPGDPLVYREICEPGGRPILLERGLGDAVARRVEGSQSGVRGLASNVVVTRATEKIALGVRYGADAVDMESYPLVDRLGRAGVAVTVMRVTSDGAHDNLPELDRALDGSGGMDNFALALAMLRAPLPSARLIVAATRALRSLERSVRALVAP